MSTYEFNFGSGFLVVVIPRLRYDDVNMSAVLRVRNNLVHLCFNQIKGFKNLSVNDITVNSLGQVEFMSSSPRYEGADVESIFKNLQNMFNEFLRSKEDEWNEMVTEFWYLISSNYPEELFKLLK